MIDKNDELGGGSSDGPPFLFVPRRPALMKPEQHLPPIHHIAQQAVKSCVLFNSRHCCVTSQPSRSSVPYVRGKIMVFTRTWIGGGNNRVDNANDWSPTGVPQTDATPNGFAVIKAAGSGT
jgi:hypothetical protein